jgi:hypothetical protein
VRGLSHCAFLSCLPLFCVVSGFSHLLLLQMETPGKRVAARRCDEDEGPSIIEMEDPDAVVGETVGGAGQKKNPRDETPVGTERGGEKKPVLEKPPKAPRAATSSTFDGLGVRGGLSLAGVADQRLRTLMSPTNSLRACSTQGFTCTVTRLDYEELSKRGLIRGPWTGVLQSRS